VLLPRESYGGGALRMMMMLGSFCSASHWLQAKSPVGPLGHWNLISRTKVYHHAWITRSTGGGKRAFWGPVVGSCSTQSQTHTSGRLQSILGPGKKRPWLGYAQGGPTSVQSPACARLFLHGQRHYMIHSARVHRRASLNLLLVRPVMRQWL
jgi:hypothetical protein